MPASAGALRGMRSVDNWWQVFATCTDTEQAADPQPERRERLDEREYDRSAFSAWLHSENEPVEMEGPPWDRTEVRKNLYVLAGPYRDLHSRGPQPDLTRVPRWTFGSYYGRRSHILDLICPAYTCHDFRVAFLTDAEQTVALPEEVKDAMTTTDVDRRVDFERVFLWKSIWNNRRAIEEIIRNSPNGLQKSDIQMIDTLKSEMEQHCMEIDAKGAKQPVAWRLPEVEQEFLRRQAETDRKQY